MGLLGNLANLANICKGLLPHFAGKNLLTQPVDLETTPLYLYLAIPDDLSGEERLILPTSIINALGFRL